ncbi:MAG: hypothetical protein ABSG49_04910 [Methanoregula sp.]|jgi:DNA-directed RNA polymerase subunit RPC12/RpoP|uniref:hypothetical protein n=1 Tax=Methanoregula sp. TaxID=2052170 RepID=UPI003C24EB0E
MTPHEAFEQHEQHESSKTCRVCSSPYSHEDSSSRFGICEKCGYKILILLVIVMVAVSYIAWFGIL